MQPKIADPPLNDVRPGIEPAGFSENLALFYQGLLTGVVRLQGQRQHIPDSEAFRRRTKATLQEVERAAAASGYDPQDIQDTHFAVVAFLDSVVLNSKDPVRAEWERRPLQEELFGKADAGIVFFEKLDRFCSRRDSEQLGDILEVYLLCLLLGFEGRYSGAPRAERGTLIAITDNLRRRIEKIRGREDEISPQPLFAPSQSPPLAQRSPGRQLRLVALILMVLTVLTFCILKLNLMSASDTLRSRLLTVF